MMCKFVNVPIGKVFRLDLPEDGGHSFLYVRLIPQRINGRWLNYNVVHINSGRLDFLRDDTDIVISKYPVRKMRKTNGIF